MAAPRLQDAHLHLQDTRLSGNLEQIIADTRAAGITRLVVNGTSPADWGKVTALHRKYPDLIIPSYGLHPWRTPAKDNAWKAQLTERIEMSTSACIGECGLDRWMPNPDRHAQEDAFRFQLELAARLNRPISIHVLKAWGWLLQILESSPRPERGFLLHSFSGSREIALQLVKLGAYFSFSGYFLQPRKANVREAFRAIPRERILLETDAPDMLPPSEHISHPLPNQLNHPANLATISHGLATTLGEDKAALNIQLEHNFQRFFSPESTDLAGSGRL